MELANISIAWENAAGGAPELLSVRTREDEVVCRLTRVLANRTEALLRRQDCLLYQLAARRNASMNQEPSEELHFGWREVAPDEVVEGDLSTPPRAELVDGRSVKGAIAVGAARELPLITCSGQLLPIKHGRDRSQLRLAVAVQPRDKTGAETAGENSVNGDILFSGVREQRPELQIERRSSDPVVAPEGNPPPVTDLAHRQLAVEWEELIMRVSGIVLEDWRAAVVAAVQTHRGHGA